MKWLMVFSLFFAVSLSLNGVKAEERTVISDVVKKIREDDEGVVVLFSKNLGSYYLRREIESFSPLKKKLEDSLNTKKPVSVTVESTQLNILEVK